MLDLQLELRQWPRRWPADKATSTDWLEGQKSKTGWGWPYKSETEIKPIWPTLELLQWLRSRNKFRETELSVFEISWTSRHHLEPNLTKHNCVTKSKLCSLRPTGNTNSVSYKYNTKTAFRRHLFFCSRTTKMSTATLRRSTEEIKVAKCPDNKYLLQLVDSVL